MVFQGRTLAKCSSRPVHPSPKLEIETVQMMAAESEDVRLILIYCATLLGVPVSILATRTVIKVTQAARLRMFGTRRLLQCSCAPTRARIRVRRFARGLQYRVAHARLLPHRYFVHPGCVEVASHILYWCGTVTWELWATQSAVHLGLRAGQLALAHICVLLIFQPLAAVAGPLSMPLPRITSLHKTLGLMLTLQVITHSIIFHQHFSLLAGAAVCNVTVSWALRRALAPY